MMAKLGVSVDYFKEYYALAYSPVLAEMYLQNNQMIGNYPLATVFFETEIQSATIRLQLRNVSDFFLDDSHYILPGLSLQSYGCRVWGEVGVAID